MMVDTVSPSSVITATNPLPTQIQPSPVEMEHVSTTPDIATNLKNGSQIVNNGSQRPLKTEVDDLVFLRRDHDKPSRSNETHNCYDGPLTFHFLSHSRYPPADRFVALSVFLLRKASS